MKRLLLCLLFALCGCGDSILGPGTVRVGIDPNWGSIDLYSQQAYVNGYLEDLLLALAKETGLRFERERANSGALLSDLAEKKYDIIISGLFPYPINETRYDFSPPLLGTGLMLLLPLNAPKETRLDRLSDTIIGVQSKEAAQFLQHYSTLIIRTYPTVPDLLTALARQEIDGALLSRIPAVNYVRDLYATTLEIVGAPLTNTGLRFLSIKDTQKKPMNLLRRAINRLERKGVLKTLQEKWQLAIVSKPSKE